jgi:hypothetical protein
MFCLTMIVAELIDGSLHFLAAEQAVRAGFFGLGMAFLAWVTTIIHRGTTRHDTSKLYGRPDIVNGEIFILANGATYLLPTEAHTVETYLQALRRAGFRLVAVREALVADVPDGRLPKELIEKDGNKPFCLAILAQKPSE